MALYVDDYGIVDTEWIICARRADGSGAHDGMYAIALLLAGDGAKMRREYIEYPTESERNEALSAIGALIRDDEGAGVPEDVGE